jgi:hypothetical protein
MEQTGNQELIARNYAFCLGNLARLGTQASGLGYRREAEELDKSYREMYEKAKGCLKGRAVIKAMGYRYMKRCYRMYLMRRLKSMEKENGGMRR